MRIAFAGVAHSHPFTDALNLRARGAEIVAVWDDDDPDRRDDFAARFGAEVRSTPDGLLSADADVVVATPRSPMAIARACADAGTPVFFNKVVAVDAAALADWQSLPDTPRFTASVLRFAPALRAFAEEIADAPVRALEVHAQHDIAGFLTAARSWQDDVSGAGGTMINVGVHAWEMLDVLMPGAQADILSARRTRGSSSTSSEVLGSVHARMADVAVTVTISGLPGADRYAVRAWTDDGMHELVLADDPDALGYGGVADAIIDFAAGGQAPVTAARTAAVYRNAITAAAVARGGDDLGRIVRGVPAPVGGDPAAGNEER